MTVADRGIGIAPAEQPRIFEPFYRAPEVIAAQIQGAGLGLSLVKRIVEAHGGRVAAAQRARSGQRVHRRAAGGRVKSRSGARASAAGARFARVKRLLLVEDEPGLVLTLRDRLTREGYSVDTSARRRERARARRRRGVRSRAARRDAAADERPRRAARAAQARDRDARHHADGQGTGRRQGRRPEARRRRLRHEAVRDDGAAGADRSQAAPRAPRRRIRSDGLPVRRRPHRLPRARR